MTLKSELKEVKKQVQYEQDTIHILKAELAYLTSPERLRELSNQYLNLKSIKVVQMIADPIIASKHKELEPLSKNKIYAANTKWKYKKGQSQYLTTVSGKR